MQTLRTVRGKSTVLARLEPSKMASMLLLNPGDEDVRDLELALLAESMRDVVHQGESVARGQLRSFGLGPGGDRGAVRAGVDALPAVP